MIAFSLSLLSASVFVTRSRFFADRLNDATVLSSSAVRTRSLINSTLSFILLKATSRVSVFGGVAGMAGYRSPGRAMRRPEPVLASSSETYT